jgi:hypothetical protein
MVAWSTPGGASWQETAVTAAASVSRSEGSEARESRGATIEGRLDPATIAFGVALRLVRLDGKGEKRGRPFGLGVGSQLRVDGGFSWSDVEAGSWQLQLVTRSVVHDLADIMDLRAVETRRIEIDSRRYRRAEVEGRMSWNGRPPPFGARFRPLDGVPLGDIRDAFEPMSTDAEGRFAVTLPPGRFCAAVPHAGGGFGDLVGSEVVEVRPGDTITCDFHLATRAVCLRVVRDGAPLVGVRTRIVLHDRFSLQFDPTDRHGMIDFALPLGCKCRVCLRGARNRRCTQFASHFEFAKP